VLVDLNRTVAIGHAARVGHAGRITRLPVAVATEHRDGAGPLWLCPLRLISAVWTRPEVATSLNCRVQTPGGFSLSDHVYRSMICPLTAIWRRGDRTVLIAAHRDAPFAEGVRRPDPAAPFRRRITANSLSWCRALDGLTHSSYLSRWRVARYWSNAIWRVARIARKALAAWPPFWQRERGSALPSTLRSKSGFAVPARSSSSRTAAAALLARGASFVLLVTDGGNPATVGQPSG